MPEAQFPRSPLPGNTVNRVGWSKDVERRGARLADEQDNPGGRVPPPLTYLLTLLLGLVLDRSLHVPFLPYGVARLLGWPLVGGGMALATWFIRTMRSANTTLDVDKPVSSLVQDGSFRYSRKQPRLRLSGDDLRR